MGIYAPNVLPHFHPTLNHFLFSEEAYRYENVLKSLKWEEIHHNMELETLGHIFQAYKIYDYYIYPRFDKGYEGDERNRVSIYFQMMLEVSKELLVPFSLLSESINSEITVNIRPSQLSLLDKPVMDNPGEPPIKITGRGRKKKSSDVQQSLQVVE